MMVKIKDEDDDDDEQWVDGRSEMLEEEEKLLLGVFALQNAGF